MRKTYAYNSVIFGVLFAILAYAWSGGNIVITIIAGIGVSVVGFIIIRLIEKALYKGADKLGEKVSDAYQKHKEQKNAQSSYGAQGGPRQAEPLANRHAYQAYAPAAQRQPAQAYAPAAQRQPYTPAAQRQASQAYAPAQGAAPQRNDRVQAAAKKCPYCAHALKPGSVFCSHCGSKIQ